MTLAICMPVFNEESGIARYLEELQAAFEDTELHIIVTEDCSSDQTGSILQDLAKASNNIIVLEHVTNQGHGISMFHAIEKAIDIGALLILTCDGDGQVSGTELKSFFNDFVTSGSSYGEGLRLKRSDPWFRRVISKSTNLLVFWTSGQVTKDANTPVRIYDLELARRLCTKVIEERIIVPNLYISSFIRLLNIPIFSRPLVWRYRLGESVVGSGWGRQRFRRWPSRRLILFCIIALNQWFSLNPKYLLRRN